MHFSRCGNFSIESEEIYVAGAPVVLRVPIRRCALAEQMIELISQTEGGKEVSKKLRIDMVNQAEDIPTYGQDHESNEEVIRAAFGPDLEAIHSAECTVERCQESCTPSFKMILLQFGLRYQAENDVSTGCLDGKLPLSDLQLLPYSE